MAAVTENTTAIEAKLNPAFGTGGATGGARLAGVKFSQRTLIVVTTGDTLDLTSMPHVYAVYWQANTSADEAAAILSAGTVTFTVPNAPATGQLLILSAG